MTSKIKCCKCDKDAVIVEKKKYSKKQMKIARVAEPRDRITGADFRKLRQGKRKRNG